MAAARRQLAGVTRAPGGAQATGAARAQVTGAARAQAAGERIRHPTEVRRALIVEAARSVIADRGLFATTMRDIAAASEVSLGTVTYHFRGIAEILAEVLDGEMDAFYAPLMAAACAQPDGRAALRALIDGFLASSPRARQHWVLWLDFWALSAHDGEYARRQAAFYQRWQQDVAAIFRRALADGTLRAGAVGEGGAPGNGAALDEAGALGNGAALDEAGALDEAVAGFMAIFDGMAAQAYLPGADFGPAEARSRLHRYVDRISR